MAEGEEFPTPSPVPHQEGHRIVVQTHPGVTIGSKPPSPLERLRNITKSIFGPTVKHIEQGAVQKDLNPRSTSEPVVGLPSKGESPKEPSSKP